jgi:hypothetical protein
MFDASTAPVPLATSEAKESFSLTWNRYANDAPMTLTPLLPMAASVGVSATLVTSNKGINGIGGVTFKLDPSAFNAAAAPVTALGEAGAFTPPLHAIATAAHTATAALLQIFLYGIAPRTGKGTAHLNTRNFAPVSRMSRGRWAFWRKDTAAMA